MNRPLTQLILCTLASTAICPGALAGDCTGQADGTACSSGSGVCVLETCNMYVDVDATGAGDGTNWCDAWTSLSDAVDAATTNAFAGTIRVANGTYLPDTADLVDARDATFLMLDDVEIKGGYAGCSATNPDQRDLTLFETILSGDIAGDDDSGGDNSENCYHVVTGTGTDETAILDGVTVTAGHANGAEPMRKRGAGIFVTQDGSAPTFNNCRIVSNTADGRGAGVYLGHTGDSVPDKNEAVFCAFTSCTFEDNIAGGSGGGLSLDTGNPSMGVTPTRVTDCTFLSNSTSASRGGGGLFDRGSAIIRDTSFLLNTAPQGGGAMIEAHSYFANCRFIKNSASVADGGAISTNGSVLTPHVFVNCLFNSNSAEEEGGAINLFNNTLAELRNCTFASNVAETGDGGAVFRGPFVGASAFVVDNSIFWRNCEAASCTLQGNQIRPNTGVLISYSVIEAGWVGDGTSIETSDPMFVDFDNPDPADDDLHLADGSPCIDRADNDAVPADVNDIDDDGDTMEPIPIDLDREARFIDDLFASDALGNGTPPIVDIGAYEFGRDCNDNGIADEQDIANCAGDPACGDCNGNDIPDECDIADCDPAVDPSCDDCNLNGRPDGCDITDMISMDVNTDDIPDECAEFIGDCEAPPVARWSCPANWAIEDNLAYPDQDMFTGPFNPILDTTDIALLDVGVEISSLLIKDAAALYATPLGGPAPTPPGDLIVNGPVVLLGGQYGPDPDAAGEAIDTVLEADSILITGCTASMTLGSTMGAVVAGGVTLYGDGEPNDPGKCEPELRVIDEAAAYSTDLVLEGDVHLEIGPQASVFLTGDFINNSTNPEEFDWVNGSLIFLGPEGPGPVTPHNFEVAGTDIGPTVGGYVSNFAIDTLEIRGGSQVSFHNTTSVGNDLDRPCSEALYVEHLVLEAGSSAILDNTRVYYVTLDDQGSALQPIGCGDLVAIQFDQIPAVSDVALAVLATLLLIAGGLVVRRRRPIVI